MLHIRPIYWRWLDTLLDSFGGLRDNYFLDGLFGLFSRIDSGSPIIPKPQSAQRKFTIHSMNFGHILLLHSYRMTWLSTTEPSKKAAVSNAVTKATATEAMILPLPRASKKVKMPPAEPEINPAPVAKKTIICPAKATKYAMYGKELPVFTAFHSIQCQAKKDTIGMNKAYRTAETTAINLSYPATP